MLARGVEEVQSLPCEDPVERVCVGPLKDLVEELGLQCAHAQGLPGARWLQATAEVGTPKGS